MFEWLSIISKAISFTSTTKKVATYVSENTAEKRKARELNKQCNELANRGFFQTLIIYIMAGAIGGYIAHLGLGWFILTLIFFFIHCGELAKVYTYISIKREIALTVLVGLTLAVCFLNTVPAVGLFIKHLLH